MWGQIVLRRAVEKKLGRIGDGRVDNGVYCALHGRRDLCCIPLFVFHQLGSLVELALMEVLEESFRLRTFSQSAWTLVRNCQSVPG